MDKGEVEDFGDFFTNVIDAEELSVNTEDERTSYNQRSATIFLIDFRESMFEKQNDGSYYFKQCIECCKNVMLNLARRQQRNFVTGIIIFGTEKCGDNKMPKNVTEVQPIDVVSAERILELDNMIIDDFKCLKEKFGQSEQFSLNLALQYSQICIKNWKRSVYRKGIILFTSDDNPHKDDISLAHKARKQAEELNALNFDLNIVPFGTFDVNKFYKELILIAKDVDLEQWAQCEVNLSIEEIIQEVENIVSKFSGHFRILHLGERKILVTLYRAFSEPKKGFISGVHIDSSRDYTISSTIVADTNNKFVLNASPNIKENTHSKEPEIWFSKDLYSYNFGGRTVEAAKTDINWNKLGMDVGLTLVGFAGSQNVLEYWTMKNPYFMLPYEKDHVGVELWKYLYSRCRSRGLSIICWYKFHKHSRPTLVSLDPLEIPVNSFEVSYGFAVRFLPFIDEIIDLEEDQFLGLYQPTEQQKCAADSLVKELTFRYDVSMFHDHEHRSFVAMVEALALKYNEVEKFQDDTIVDLDEIPEDIIENLQRCEMEVKERDADCVDDDSQAGRKRKGESLKEGRTKKQQKELGHQEIIEIVKKKKAHDLNMAQLKSLLKFEGVKCISLMTKPKLIAAAYSIFCRQE